MQWEESKDPAVLFVCLGNICRSPMAEGAFRKAAQEAGLLVEVDSVGTASYHIGEAPDPRAIAVADQNGVDISQLRGRQLADEDFERFTHIIALDTANLAGVNSRAPRKTKAEIALLLDVYDNRTGASVADPYYGDKGDFEQCWNEVSKAASELVKRLSKNPQTVRR